MTPSLVVYSAFIPALPLREGAERYLATEGVRVEVKAGRPEQWMPRLRAGESADLFSCGAEFLLDVAEASGLVEPGTRVGLGSRRAALVVPAKNPAHVIGPADLARGGIRIGIAVEGCTLGLWDEVGCRTGLVGTIRERTVARAKGCGDLLGIVRRREVDVAFGWRNFDRVPDLEVEVVPLPEALEVRRTTGIAVVAGSPRAGEARRFVAWLASEHGRAIYRRWGWDVD